MDDKIEKRKEGLRRYFSVEFRPAKCSFCDVTCHVLSLDPMVGVRICLDCLTEWFHDQCAEHFRFISERT